MSKQQETLDDGDISLQGKYLSFLLQAEEYGVRILKVREIIALQDITPIPRMPDYIKGVINLRGRIIPIVDLRLKLGLTAPEDTDHTCIIVLEVEGGGDAGVLQIGCIVDTVSEVLDITDIEPPPNFGSATNTDFILGLGKIKEKNLVVALLDIDMILASSEVLDLGRQTDSDAVLQEA